MLLRFAVSNFLSISEEIDFTMFPYTRLREKKDHIYRTPQVDLLKTAAIYGANGSGKSNLIKAMAFMRDFAVQGDLFKTKTPIGPFRLNAESLKAPSCFEIEFHHGSQYFAYELQATRHEIIAEILWELYPDVEERTVLFERNRVAGKENVQVAEKYRSTEADAARIDIYVKELLQPTASLLHIFARNESFPEMRSVLQWFQDAFMVIQPDLQFINLAEILYRKPEFKAYALNILKTLDTGVTDVDLHRMPFDEFFGLDEDTRKQEALAALNQGYDYIKLHVYDEELLLRLEDGELIVYRAVVYHQTESGTPIMFALREESDGTRRALDFLPVWLTLKTLPATIIIDEIGRSLHPSMLEHLISIFMSAETKGQLIFTTHEDSLLSQELFRRDEIRLMNKTRKGNSEIYPLSDFKARNDTDLRRNYLFGRFGGTPNLRHYFSLEQRAAVNE